MENYTDYTDEAWTEYPFPVEHTFRGSDTPGVFECPVEGCGWSAHFEREDQRYCVHPADESEPAFLISDWSEAPEHTPPPTKRWAAQWYMRLTGVGPGFPNTLYGVQRIEARSREEAASIFDELLDVDFLAHPVYQLIPQVGAVEFDLDTLPAEWNFEEPLVLVDLDEEYVIG